MCLCVYVVYVVCVYVVCVYVVCVCVYVVCVWCVCVYVVCVCVCAYVCMWCVCVCGCVCVCMWCVCVVCLCERESWNYVPASEHHLVIKSGKMIKKWFHAQIHLGGSIPNCVQFKTFAPTSFMCKCPTVEHMHSANFHTHKTIS